MAILFLRKFAFVMLTLVLLIEMLTKTPVTVSAKRHHNHSKKVSRAIAQSQQEYEYRDTTEYDGGVAIDSVPIKTNFYDTPTPPVKEHHFSNRFTPQKLRKFFADSQRYYQRK